MSAPARIAHRLLVSAGLLTSCSETEDRGLLAPASDCAPLVQAARRAGGCDPNLVTLASALAQAPDETRCRAAARRLLSAGSSAASGVRSLLEPLDPPSSPLPLTPAERAGLAALVLPATLTIIPDLAPGPGVPQTSATLDSVALESDVRGRLHARVEPGLHTVVVRHAGQETQHCVDLEQCGRLVVAAHGSTLARHSRLRRGACRVEN